jgi:hypothetical protein
MGSNRRTDLPQQAPPGPTPHAAAANSKTSAQNGSGVPCPSWFPVRSGARDGQKHLPDRLHTSDNEPNRSKGQPTGPPTENASSNPMRDLNYQLKQLCHRNRDGSFATQRDRERVLDLVANQLQEAGFRHLGAASLKPKHVKGLVARWQAEGLAVGTIKNRMAELRWWAEKIGKSNVVARDNHQYGISNRQHVTNVSKARELSGGELARITDPYTAMSLRLQAAFGLRREESIKARPEWADRGNVLVLKDTWTKGGRPREVPVRNAEQRRLLDEAKVLAGWGSLVPADKTYAEQLRRFEHQCAAAGIHRVHGFRHQYAQVRYRELTGWAAPAAGGPRSRELTTEQKALDREARLTISAELGHERELVTAVYLGR